MTNEQLSKLESVALEKLTELLSRKDFVAIDSVESCILVLKFCKDTWNKTEREPVASTSNQWTLIPKMKVMCMKQDDPSFGKTGILVPSGLLNTGRVLWAVLIDNVRAWDACEEHTIRRDFIPSNE